jgi:hypothetical protein
VEVSITAVAAIRIKHVLVRRGRKISHRGTEARRRREERRYEQKEAKVAKGDNWPAAFDLG